MKILILKPSSLGDVIHALPVLRLIKLHQPQSEVYWWLEAGLMPLLEGDPDLAGTFRFHRKRWAAPMHWPEMVRSVRAMRRKRFDVAIDLQGLARSAIFTWLSNAGVNLGLGSQLEGSREGARAAYDRVAPQTPEGTHAVDRYLSVLPLLGVPVHERFQWLPERPAVSAQVREKWQPGGQRWIMLLPGARWNNKRWPVENFTELARQLLRIAPELRIGILGGNDDCALGYAIAAVDPARCLDLTGRTSLPEMIEWIRLSELTITNDTGPMHVAAALRKPVIALFGPTNPNDTGPYGQKQNVLQVTHLPCVPCMKSSCSYVEPLACLRAITPAQVCAQARQRLLVGAGAGEGGQLGRR
ncbi:MAG: Lipopolysaccharide heptosyltransferase [Pedosphaera sp.]|nr:Lipopolysaccharide heptosyltransferase [Pedosphaera sp.]